MATIRSDSRWVGTAVVSGMRDAETGDQALCKAIIQAQRLGLAPVWP